METFAKKRRLKCYCLVVVTTGEFTGSCPLLVLGGTWMLNAVIAFSVALIGLWVVDGEQNLRIWLMKIPSGILKSSSDDGCGGCTF